jgi:hypothetical protein
MQKHFLVSWWIQPDNPTASIERLEIEAVFCEAVQVVTWRDRQGDSLWQRNKVGIKKVISITALRLIPYTSHWTL